MISEKMKPLVNNNSAIRAMFEEGKRLAAKYGAENVYDFSLGNPNVPAPAEVNQAIIDLVKEEDPVFLHGYMSNAGYEDVRRTVAESLNKRFGTHFHENNILMTVGAASGLNVILKTLLNPGDEVLTFAQRVLATKLNDDIAIAITPKDIYDTDDGHRHVTLHIEFHDRQRTIDAKLVNKSMERLAKQADNEHDWVIV